MTTRIDLDDGKYTVLHDNGRDFRALRYGEPWRELTGDKLVFAMACEIERLREQVATRLPMQPIETDARGVMRFKENRIVGNLLERYGNMNEIAKEAAQGKYTAEEQMQFAQLIGYSVSGYCALPYVSDESAALAKSLITVLQSTHTTTEPKQ